MADTANDKLAPQGDTLGRRAWRKLKASPLTLACFGIIGISSAGYIRIRGLDAGLSTKSRREVPGAVTDKAIYLARHRRLWS